MHESTFLGKHDGPRVLSLGGRAWQVNQVDWPRRTAYVEPSEAEGRSRWTGASQGLSFALSQAIRRVFASEECPDFWARRAREEIDGLRRKFPWLDTSSTVVRTGDDASMWWTFGGHRANAILAHHLTGVLGRPVMHDSLALTFDATLSLREIEPAIDASRRRPPAEMRPAVNEEAVRGLKFSECLPIDLAAELLERRLHDPAALQGVLESPLRFVT